ncbi:MAG: hypothetical protein ABJA62_11605, partial [Luteimonas sp.]
MHDARPAESGAKLSGSHVLGALALERVPGSSIARDALPQHDAAALAAAMAHDLARFAPEAADLECAVVGAHYDPVELLRPSWPIHRLLQDLAARAPITTSVSDAHGRIIAFGAHDARLPDGLTPCLEHADGPLRLVPFVLSGDAAALARVREVYERELMERGMAGAQTAL